MPHRILRLPEVRQRTGLSKSSIYSGIAAGTFIAPIRLTARVSGWLESDIERWIEQRIAETYSAQHEKNK